MITNMTVDSEITNNTSSPVHSFFTKKNIQVGIPEWNEGSCRAIGCKVTKIPERSVVVVNTGVSCRRFNYIGSISILYIPIFREIFFIDDSILFHI